MIHIYNSHSLDKLAHRFSNILEMEQVEPLQPIWVVVQNNEIKEWLSLQLASRQGITGNFRFIFPSEFMWALYRLKEKDIPQSLPSDLNSMQWALFELFGKAPELLDLIPVYDTSADSPQKRFQLSSDVADIFDQYQVYRPEMTEAWLERKLVTKNKHEQWQSAVWKRLNEYWRDNEVINAIPSRSGAYNDLIDWFEEGEESFINQLPERIFVFGLSHLNRPFLEIISRLSAYKDVHFLQRRSSLDLKNADLQKLLTDWSASSEDQMELFQILLNERDSESNIVKLDDNPVSVLPALRVHSCHNSRREAEVLKDSVLEHLDKNPHAGPEDILILVPDTETYISELETVCSGNDEETALPISQLFRTQQSEEHALLAILDALDSSYKPSTILELVNLHSIKQTFSFSDGELELMEQWIIDNKIHRGIGDSFNSPYSWQKGVNQLLLGFIMEPGELDLYRNLVPYQAISAKEEMLLAARFSTFLHSFIEAVNRSQAERTPNEWLDFISDLTHTFLNGDTEDRASGLYRDLAKLKEQLRYSDVSEKVSFRLFKSWIKTQFVSNESSSGRFGQGMTVSSYIPYRSVPFRFIAVLGLNEGVFPRKSVRPEFDLIHASPQPGDRIQKDDDTYLFLETLLAARDHLHISYQGQDQRSDAKRLPSMVVQRLMDAMPEANIPLLEHKLHPFSTKYFISENPLRSYSLLNLKVAENLQNKKGSAPVFSDQDLILPDDSQGRAIHITDLILFFTNPSKYIAQSKLGLSNSIYLNEIIDRESFSLNSLESYYLDDFIHTSLLKEKPKDSIFNYAQGSGMIPDKLKGEKVFQNEFDQIRELHLQLRSITSEQEEVLDVELTLNGTEISGKIPGIYGDLLVTSRTGKRKPKYEIGHWLKHLILLESGFPIQKSVFISKEGSDLELFELHSRDIPKRALSDYVKWFSGNIPVLSKAAFFPDTSKAYAQKWRDEKDKKEAIYAARKAWEPSYNHTFVESNDYYNTVLWRNRDPLVLDDFHKNAIRFWEPFLQACGDEG